MSVLIIQGVGVVLMTMALTAQVCRADLWGSLKAFKDSAVSRAAKTSLNDTKLADGLKEALRVGIDKTVELTGRTDGFLKNSDIKIPLPEQLSKADKMLRMVGFGKYLDEFVLSMNRAAEAATPAAKEIFINAITGMTIEDAAGIYKGGHTAATTYLRNKASAPLRTAFAPMVHKSLAQFAVTQKYDELMNRYRALPLASSFPVPDLKNYVLDKTLDGLFQVLAQQETSIRTNPAARVTSLLKEVFK